jgi:similar to stage IV sporulation protein
LGRRKLFAAGIAGFVIGLYLLSSLVWQVTVTGNEKLTETQILETAKAAGIRPMQWKFRLKDPDSLARTLHAALPGTSWVGVEIHGTELIIKIVESKEPDKKPELAPQHLIATRNALVTQIFAEKGKPLVAPQTYVRKGAVLISGVIGDENNSQLVAAAGKVTGLVWYSSHIEVPMTQSYKTYTGESFKRSYLTVGSRALKLTGYRQKVYDSHEIIAEKSSVNWRGYSIPLGWMKEKVMEYRVETRKLTPVQAERIGLMRARSDILLEAGSEAKIAGEKVLARRLESGRMIMEVHFEVDQPIAVGLPISAAPPAAEGH